MTIFNSNGKRSRNDADDDVESLPEQKKIFGTPLPFRTSPTIKHTRPFSQLKRNAPQPLFTQTITPTDSEDEISPQCPPKVIDLPRFGDQSEEQSRGKNSPADMEMSMGSPQRRYTPRDLDLDSMMLSPKASPFTILPTEQSCGKTPESAIGGRLPTPIYGHFQTVNTDISPVSSLEPSPQKPVLDSEYERHMRARRLPTPISEDEAMDSFESPDEDMFDPPATQLRQPARFPPPSTQPLKRNKPMFSMGFRADCDMCRNRVPGHYNHIFWS